MAEKLKVWYDPEGDYLDVSFEETVGVIGKPNPVAMEIVKAFVALKDGYEEPEELRRELRQFAIGKLGKAVAPREIEFLPGMPKTRSGKIMRRLLKARELGLPEGDTSTLED